MQLYLPIYTQIYPIYHYLVIITLTCPNLSICNELGGGPAPAVFRRDRRRLIRFPQRTTDTLWYVLVYNDLMIRNNTVPYYNTNRSRPVTVQYITTGPRSVDRDDLPQPYSELGTDYSSVLPYGF